MSLQWKKPINSLSHSYCKLWDGCTEFVHFSDPFLIMGKGSGCDFYFYFFVLIKKKKYRTRWRRVREFTLVSFVVKSESPFMPERWGSSCQWVCDGSVWWGQICSCCSFQDIFAAKQRWCCFLKADLMNTSTGNNRNVMLWTSALC